ncbi:MAG: flagellar hook protein FlgE [Defluviitaleaceae bacterium]|nr:flagellar hook protein FlgE [Defluviitaleaceae bacterium]
MMRSMFSGVSGLRIHQTRMDVVAHNISNVNTVGFKGSRALFSDVFSQTVANASGPAPGLGRGGVNPMQIGLGGDVSSIDRMMTQGAAQRTDHNFDLMLEGSGFFIVGDASGTFFTRAGALRLDRDMNLTIANGMMVQGWRINENTAAETEADRWQVNRGPVQGIHLTPTDMFAPPQRTTDIRFSGNLLPGAGVPQVLSMNFHDSIGNVHTLMVHATEGTGSEWAIEIQDPRPQIPAPVPAWDAGVRTLAITFDANGIMNLAPDVAANPIGPGGANFDVDDRAAATDPWPGTVTFTLPDFIIEHFLGADSITEIGTTGAAPGELTLNFGGLVQFGNTRPDAQSVDWDGRPAGRLMDLAVGQDGVVMGIYDNGDQRSLWQIPIAEFDNPAGLESIGGSLFTATANSGQFDGIGVDGVMRGGVLEMSNVDLSAEFTDMIITQRGFQANSRIIGTSDEMLQVLVNL